MLLLLNEADRRENDLGEVNVSLLGGESQCEIFAVGRGVRTDAAVNAAAARQDVSMGREGAGNIEGS